MNAAPPCAALPGRRAFTIPEMMAILGLLGVLAGLVLPRVFAAQASSRAEAAASAFTGTRSAALLYLGQYGKFAGVKGAKLTADAREASNWDALVLMPEGFLDHPFRPAVAGAGARFQLVPAAPGAAIPSGSNPAYNLDGRSASPNDAGSGQQVLEAVLCGVTLDDARKLNWLLDGASPLVGEARRGKDVMGRVKYDFGTESTGEVHIYVADH